MILSQSYPEAGWEGGQWNSTPYALFLLQIEQCPYLHLKTIFIRTEFTGTIRFTLVADSCRASTLLAQDFLREERFSIVQNISNIKY